MSEWAFGSFGEGKITAQNLGTKIGLVEHIYFVVFCTGCTVSFAWFFGGEKTGVFSPKPFVVGQNFHICSQSGPWNIRLFTTPIIVELKQCSSSGLNLYMFSKVMHVLYFRVWVWVCTYSVCCVINSPGAKHTSEIKLRGKLLHNCSRLSNLETLQTQSSNRSGISFPCFCLSVKKLPLNCVRLFRLLL